MLPWYHSASCSTPTGFLCHGLERWEREADQTLPPNVEVKNEWMHILTPPHFYMASTETALPSNLFYACCRQWHCWCKGVLKTLASRTQWPCYQKQTSTELVNPAPRELSSSVASPRFKFHSFPEGKRWDLVLYNIITSFSIFLASHSLFFAISIIISMWQAFLF